MASSSILLVFTIALLSISVAQSRPCKTLIISTFAYSSNPNPNNFVTIEITRFHPVPLDRPDFSLRPFPLRLEDLPRHQPFEARSEEEDVVKGYNPFAFDFDSLRERTKDVLSVVVALLFGVGCGALTAAIMYFAWSLWASRFFGNSEFDDDYEEVVDEVDEVDEDELYNPKKAGYVAVPIPPPAKEVA